MKILCLSAYLPGRGLHGGSSRIFELFHYLHRFHELTLLTFRSKNDDDSRVHELKQMCDKLIIVPMSERRPFYLFPFEPFIDYMSVEFRTRLQKLLKKERYDLAQLEYIQMGIYLKELGSIPTVLTGGALTLGAFLRKVKMYYDSLQVMKRELEILQRVDRIICMNRLEADELHGYVPADKIDVLPHGVDTDYFAPHDAADVEPLSIGFFGAYHHYPNVDAVHFFVDRVFPLIRERLPEAKFYVIGIHPPKEFHALRDRPGVVITGFVPDIREALARCQVIVEQAGGRDRPGRGRPGRRRRPAPDHRQPGGELRRERLLPAAGPPVCREPGPRGPEAGGGALQLHEYRAAPGNHLPAGGETPVNSPLIHRCFSRILGHCFFGERPC